MRQFSLVLACLVACCHSRQSVKKNDLARLLLATSPVLRSPKGVSAQRLPAKVQPVMAAGGEDRFVPDMQRRNLMNLILTGSVGIMVLWLGLPYLDFILLVRATYRPNRATGGAPALDKIGNQLTFEGWLKGHEAGERELTQGLKGDPTWIVTTAEKKVLDYAITAVCTHLGCTVPWNKQQNKYMCPCHGSQYDFSGKVIRGPAPLSLALVHVDDPGTGVITLSKWTEQDFRTGLDPWWAK